MSRRTWVINAGVEFPRGPVLMLLGVLAACGDRESPAPVSQPPPPPPVVSTPAQPDTAEPLPPPSATFNARTDIDAGELGMPLYPGARVIDSGTWDLQGPQPEATGAITSLKLHSADPIASVVRYYRAHLPDAQFLEIDHGRGKRVSITVAMPDQASTNAVLRENGAGTLIEITKLGTASAAAPPAAPEKP